MKIFYLTFFLVNMLMPSAPVEGMEFENLCDHTCSRNRCTLPGMLWAVVVPDLMEYLPAHESVRWVEAPWEWADSRNPPDS